MNYDLHYPLLNVYITLKNLHFLLGKSNISMAIFNSKLFVDQRASTLTLNYCGWLQNPEENQPDGFSTAI